MTKPNPDAETPPDLALPYDPDWWAEYNRRCNALTADVWESLDGSAAKNDRKKDVAGPVPGQAQEEARQKARSKKGTRS